MPLVSLFSVVFGCGTNNFVNFVDLLTSHGIAVGCAATCSFKKMDIMAQEIERKFLVTGEFKSSAKDAVRIRQGYLSSVPECTVRVRAKGEKGYITIKGLAADGGLSRFEWEKEITLEDVKELLNLCEKGVIDKTRYLVEVGGHTFEVDEFYGENEGLVVAEIELSSEDEIFERPEWLGREVTGDTRYYNSMLMKCPYKDWGK